jgi:hypothetical protein
MGYGGLRLTAMFWEEWRWRALDYSNLGLLGARAACHLC